MCLAALPLGTAASGRGSVTSGEFQQHEVPVQVCTPLRRLGKPKIASGVWCSISTGHCTPSSPGSGSISNPPSPSECGVMLPIRGESIL
eukprot:3275834-Rhodomonas_salina.1